MKQAEKIQFILDKLEELYPETPIPLDHKNPFELLVAVLLSAQTTDAMVNRVTPELFRQAPNAKAMSELDEIEILELIRKIGLAPTKSKNLKKLSQILVEKYQGEVPEGYEKLEALPGVGHKTASVVMSQAFHHPAFPVDTHIHRLAWRWKLSNGKSVEQSEKDLKRLFPEDKWNKLHLQIIYFGREYCPARNHKREACPICSVIGRKQGFK
jgi:endonuclease-3